MIGNFSDSDLLKNNYNSCCRRLFKRQTRQREAVPQSGSAESHETYCIHSLTYAYMVANKVQIYEHHFPVRENAE